VFDRQGIDAVVNGVAQAIERSSELMRKTQTGYIRNYALAVLMGVVVIVGYFLLR